MPKVKPKHLSAKNKKAVKLDGTIITMGQRWKLVPVADFIGDPDLQGMCDKDRREIQFKSNIATDAMLDCIVHEITHAYQEINRFPDDLGDNPQEYLAQWTSAIMVDFIRNNPAFVLLLISSWKETA